MLVPCPMPLDEGLIQDVGGAWELFCGRGLSVGMSAGASFLDLSGCLGFAVGQGVEKCFLGVRESTPACVITSSNSMCYFLVAVTKSVTRP